MKRIIFTAFALSLMYAATASAMITVTKHNFSAGAGAGGQARNVYLTTSGSGNEAAGEVCVFCHTPHGASSSAPLWNRQMATAGAYSPYTSSTLDAPGANGDRQPKGISLACLSCHDGTIAIDALRNAPGSGNFIEAATARDWAWTGLTAADKLNAGVTNLTQDLRTQHPISIQYPNVGSGTVFDPKFYVPGGSHSSGAKYFVESGTGATAGMDDHEVRLYVTNADADVFVECASCHNPHGTEAVSFGGTAGPDGTNFATFLRKSNVNSALCTTCHIK